MSNSRFFRLLGTIAFWLSWPALWIYLRGSQRTRVLIVCDEEILLVRGWLSTGQWSLPGGGLHKNEDPVAGAQREVAEEVGISLTASQCIPLDHNVAHEHGF